MDRIRNGISASELSNANWRKSSRSGAAGNCVELAPLPDERIAVRNSRDPRGPALVLPLRGVGALAAATRTGHVHVPETTDDHLRALVDRGYSFVHPRDSNGDVIAVVGVRAHHSVIDVVRLIAEDDVVAYRVPGDTEDVLAPVSVHWQRSGSAGDVLRALRELPDDHTPGVAVPTSPPVRGVWVATRPGHARWLPASA